MCHSAAADATDAERSGQREEEEEEEEEEEDGKEEEEEETDGKEELQRRLSARGRAGGDWLFVHEPQLVLEDARALA